MVIEGDRQVAQEGEDGLLIQPEALEQVPRRRLLDPSALAPCALG
jgi:hypothetical protein